MVLLDLLAHQAQTVALVRQERMVLLVQMGKLVQMEHQVQTVAQELLDLLVLPVLRVFLD